MYVELVVKEWNHTESLERKGPRVLFSYSQPANEIYTLHRHHLVSRPFTGMLIFSPTTCMSIVHIVVRVTRTGVNVTRCSGYVAGLG
jgi:hypothetical protein